ncbi:hypothetical protein MYFR107205_14635 [Mycolicibacterium frederiksbergense]
MTYYGIAGLDEEGSLLATSMPLQPKSSSLTSRTG